MSRERAEREAKAELLASIERFLAMPEPQMISLREVAEAWNDRTWNEAIEAAAKLINARPDADHLHELAAAIRALKPKES